MPRRMSASGSFMDLWLDRSGTELDSATHPHSSQTHPPQLRLSARLSRRRRTLIDDDLNGLKAIEVADNGHGIPYAEAEALFSRLGGSWKRSRTHPIEEKRILHGKEGRGVKRGRC